jgi:hypothetical protein
MVGKAVADESIASAAPVTPAPSSFHAKLLKRDEEFRMKGFP